MPAPRFPENRCLGILVPMNRSASPLRPILFVFFAMATCAMFLARFCIWNTRLHLGYIHITDQPNHLRTYAASRYWMSAERILFCLPKTFTLNYSSYHHEISTNVVRGTEKDIRTNPSVFKCKIMKVQQGKNDSQSGCYTYSLHL